LNPCHQIIFKETANFPDFEAQLKLFSSLEASLDGFDGNITKDSKLRMPQVARYI
jgi:hypothetical protein